MIETLYHVLWELVHVFFDQRGLLAGREAKQVHDAGASSFLYPFLGETQTDLAAVLADVRASVELKSQEVGELRRQTLADNREVLVAAAVDLRRCFDAGAKLLALGNGGSATDAIDLVADLRYPPHGWESRRAIDLTEDTGDHHRGRQRHRHRGDLPAPGDRLRTRGGCARRALDQRQLRERDRGARAGATSRR